MSGAKFVDRKVIEPGHSWALQIEPNGTYTGLDERENEAGETISLPLQPHQVAKLLGMCGREGEPAGGRLYP